ncbi:hypothetical protein NL108_004156 [Boleophthalmus pectinirostris]|nr:hypothetical protein NL108_004156 [Boleophthalmus pectinirostris]
MIRLRQTFHRKQDFSVGKSPREKQKGISRTINFRLKLRSVPDQRGGVRCKRGRGQVQKGGPGAKGGGVRYKRGRVQKEGPGAKGGGSRCKKKRGQVQKGEGSGAKRGGVRCKRGRVQVQKGEGSVQKGEELVQKEEESGAKGGGVRCKREKRRGQVQKEEGLQ